MEESKNNGESLKVTDGDRYRAVGELIKKSAPSTVYYSLLIFSSIIVGCGVLLNNMAILIGGMLVAPVLTPALALALGVSVGDVKLISKEFWLLVKSFIIIAAAAAVMTIIFGKPENFFAVENTLRAAALWFTVAVASGAGATYAWVRKEIADVLPGIAVSVSLVPPISLTGVLMMAGDFFSARFYFLVFSLNLLGIVIGSLVVFSMLRFYKAEKRIKSIESESQEG
jgi:uncharacterized hydrophobic protein (TIGR00271 family)